MLKKQLKLVLNKLFLTEADTYIMEELKHLLMQQEKMD